MIVAFVKSLRPRQWVKNVSVLVAAVFSEGLFDPAVGLVAFAAAGVFCLLASGVYLLNDLVDRSRDALHPVKRRRPIASGALGTGTAGVASAVLIAASLALGYALGTGYALLLVLYLGVQVAYTFALRRVVLLDVFCIAAGFVIRVFAGGVVIGADISSWLILTTIFLSLFLALAKRRAELTAMEGDHAGHRATLKEYDAAILDQLISVTTASVVICYSLYTLDQRTFDKFHTRNLVLTVPLVVFGVFRYLFLIHRKNQGGEPSSTLLKDAPLALSALLWAGLVVLILYMDL